MAKIRDMLMLRRKELKLTQKSLSEKTGISVVSLAKYESGERLPSFENLNRLAEALRLDYDEACNVLKAEKESKRKQLYGSD